MTKEGLYILNQKAKNMSLHHEGYMKRSAGGQHTKETLSDINKLSVLSAKSHFTS